MRQGNAEARSDAARVRHELDELQAKTTNHGWLVTLDDALFTTNDASLSNSGRDRLNTLAGFLDCYPNGAVSIHGYAGAGSYRYDLTLIKRRADAIKAYLIREGIASSRLTMRSDVKTPPNDGSGPQRRVEVIIEDPLTSVSQPM